jgi:hypothetical protein
MFNLLVASGIITTITSIIVFFYMMPNKALTHLDNEPISLDKIIQFPIFSTTNDLTTEELVRKMEPVVMIVSSDMQGPNPSRNSGCGHAYDGMQEVFGIKESLVPDVHRNELVRIIN